jgi:hypothetical protein
LLVPGRTNDTQYNCSKPDGRYRLSELRK